MGTQPLHAVHRTVLVVDVSAFSGRPRVPQEEIRRGLYAALETAFVDNGLDWSAAHHEDRGDGVLVLVPPDVPKSRVVDGVPHALLGQLRRYNATRTEESRIRLRMAITAGEVQYDPEGVVGDDVTLAFRLLDSRPLREALDRSTALFALIVSDRIHADVVRPDPALDLEAFRRVSVDVKEVHGHAWLHVPNGGTPAIGRRPTRHRRKRRRPPVAPVLLAVALLFVGTTNAARATPPAVPPCPPPIQLNVLVSAEKEEVVRSLALELEDDSGRHNPLGCKEFNALVFTGGSARAAAEALGRGWQPGDLTAVGAEPHVWLPDSRAEVLAIGDDLRERPDVTLHVRAGVAVSPLVLGASEELAAQIAPDGEFEWRHVAKPAAVDLSSGVGLLAAAALAQAELGPDLDSPRAAWVLHDITRRTSTDAPCVGEVAVIGSENAVAATDGCRVLYPRDGALVLDHPFVEVERPQRHNPRRQRIVHRLLEHLRAPGAQAVFKRAGFRDLAWNVIAPPDSGVRPDRPLDLPLQPRPGSVREAWEAASRPRTIGVATDSSPDAHLFAEQVSRLAGPGDRVITLPLTEDVVEAGVRAGAHVVVLASATPVPILAKGVSRPVRVVAVGFTEGACAPSTALYAAATAMDGPCHVVGGLNDPGAAEGREAAVHDVARAAWGG
ncbi:extracellular solute-binding protein [Saccharothrix carnea]|uniref:Extracellular solute-binding protein n=1 Tax=Saccharothrix carnea TaxID=1280637 RepID=A0A2P8IDG5_SACCR|nr:substrate-binding domain-containing protein [Saccharothrix carnea]PSL56502.1 extracellular solute-binding protein [Saccharothrix carnea]